MGVGTEFFIHLLLFILFIHLLLFSGQNTWKTVLRDYVLMPSPHHECGGQDYFIVNAEKQVSLLHGHSLYFEEKPWLQNDQKITVQEFRSN